MHSHRFYVMHFDISYMHINEYLDRNDSSVSTYNSVLTSLKQDGVLSDGAQN